MELIFYPFIFLFGLVVGSFLNVVIFRLESGEQVARGRSHCQYCRHTLEWHDLIPVLSFLALGGKCRYCKKKLSIQYPLVELATGMLFVFTVQFFDIRYLIFDIKNLLTISYYLFITSALIVIFVYDFRHYIIPDKIVYSAIVITFLYQLAISQYPISNIQYFISFILAAFLASGFFFAIVVITKGAGMGGGDVKLAFLMGLALGWPKILAALFLTFTIGAICGIILIALKRKKFKSEIPFGPFLVLGTFAALFWGEEIVKWYAGYLF